MTKSHFNGRAGDAPKKLCFEGQVAEGNGEAARKGPRPLPAAKWGVRLAPPTITRVVYFILTSETPTR